MLKRWTFNSDRTLHKFLQVSQIELDKDYKTKYQNTRLVAQNRLQKIFSIFKKNHRKNQQSPDKSRQRNRDINLTSSYEPPFPFTIG